MGMRWGPQQNYVPHNRHPEDSSTKSTCASGRSGRPGEIPLHARAHLLSEVRRTGGGGEGSQARPEPSRNEVQPQLKCPATAPEEEYKASPGVPTTRIPSSDPPDHEYPST